jgi:hypothetical protein
MTLAATTLGVLAACTAVPFIVGMLTTNENPLYLDAGRLASAASRARMPHDLPIWDRAGSPRLRHESR